LRQRTPSLLINTADPQGDSGLLDHHKSGSHITCGDINLHNKTNDTSTQPAIGAA
jgi:hypothetical protein